MDLCKHQTVTTTGTTMVQTFVYLSHSLPHHGLFGVHLLWGRRGHFLDDRGDVGGPVQLDLGETILVGLHHTLNPCNTWNRFTCFLLIALPCLFICILHYANLTRSRFFFARKVSAKINQILHTIALEGDAAFFKKAFPCGPHKDETANTQLRGRNAAMWREERRSPFHTYRLVFFFSVC